ncbi:FAR-17a/AIG1-like protein [Xylariales sp. PMI_506]|nr:FAR-17a/AIG1-like protein [Xylariales sp. PMI_506]
MARHPLQRFEAPSRQFSLLLHAAGIVSFIASFKFLFAWDVPIAHSYGGHFQFLTIIGLSLSLITFVIGLAADLTLSPALFGFKNYLAVGSAPLEILITILYWGLCAIDKSLVFPPDMQLDLLPDIGFHAAPGIFLALDLLLLSPPWSIHISNALTLSMIFGVLYFMWIEYCYSQNGWYTYPIFALLNVWQRGLLFVGSATMMAGSTIALKWLHGKLNGVESFKKEAIKNPVGIHVKDE